MTNLAREHRPIERWDEDRTKHSERLILRADSFRPERLFDTKSPPRWSDGIESPGGSFIYCNRILPAGTPLDLSLGPTRSGTVVFDGDVVLPTLFDITGPSPDPWMSLTPKEMITQRPGVLRASGTVVVGELGLGWFLRKVHDRPQVERVILVEGSGELFDRYGHDLCRRLPTVTDVIFGDVYDHIGRLEAGAKRLLDIWKDYGGCLLDERFLRHKRRYKHVWGWGDEVMGPASRQKPRALGPSRPPPALTKAT